MIDELQTKEKLFSDLDELKDKIKNLKDTLKSDTLKLNKQINEEINIIIKLIGEIRDNKKSVIDLSKDENDKFEKEYSSCKEEFKRLKSLHITKYNEKISQVNRRVSPFRNKSIGPTFSEEVKVKIKSIPDLRPCNLLRNNSAWTDNKYLSVLEYDKIEIAELIVQQLESELNVKNDNVIDEMSSIATEIENVLETMKKDMKNGLTIQNIDKYLFECGTLSGRLLVLNNEHDKLRDKCNQVVLASFSDKIVKLQKEIYDVRDELFKKKQEINTKNTYDSMKDELEILERDYTELVEMYFVNENKFTMSLVADYKRRMNKFNVRFKDIKKRVEESFKEGKINVKQLSNLKERYATISSIHSELDEKLDDEPVVINNNIVYLSSVEKDLNKLEEAIVGLGEGPVRDREKRKSVEAIIKKIETNFKGFDSLLISYKKNNLDEYNVLKNKYDEYKERFEELNNSYNEKCPLVIKKIREAKPIYEKHKKLGLISAGLASMSLVTSSFTLVPALMHGNSVLGNAVPGIKGMTSFFNKILGSFIGASVGKNGAWVLATGTVLTGAVATTSILKFIATIGVGTAALTAPLYIPQLILKVKDLVGKIKEYDFKKKLSDTYQTGVKKVNETVKKVDDTIKKVEQRMNEYDLTNYYEDLYIQYAHYSKNMSLEEFCKKNKLSDKDKAALVVLINRAKLDNKLKKIVGEQVKSKRKAKLA